MGPAGAGNAQEHLVSYLSLEQWTVMYLKGKEVGEKVQSVSGLITEIHSLLEIGLISSEQRNMIILMILLNLNFPKKSSKSI